MKTKKKGKGNKGLTALIIALLVVVGLFLTLVNLIIEFQWFNELGYASVFLTRIFTQIAIAVPLFIVTGLIVFVYLKVLKKGYYRKIESHINDKSVEKKLNIAAAGLAAIAGGILAYYVASLTWFEVLRFMHRTPFDLVDPQFGLDISFYVFQLDLIRQVNNILIGVIVGFAALTAVYYALLMSFRRPQVFEDVYDDDDEEFGGHQRGRQQSKGNMEDFITQILQMLGVPAGGQNQQQNRGAQPQPKKKLDDENLTNILKIASNQVRVLGVLFFIMVGVHFFLRQFDILFSSTGAVFGAGFTDVTVTLWMHRLLAVLSLAAAVGFVLGLNKKKLRTILTVPAIMVLVGGLGAASAFVVQQYVVSPDELNRERAFLYRNITYTRIAYGLDNVDVRYFPVQNTLTRADIDNNRETIANIRINDHEPVRRFYSNMQAIRPYYVFPAVFVDRYIIDGELTQTFVAAREIDDTARSPIPQTFVNRHLLYTHGFGVTLSRVDQISPSGLPEMLIRNIPPVSDVPEIEITNAAIYFGLMTHDYILINTTEDEFHFPRGEGGNAVHRYTGDAGIELGFWNRLMFSIRERDLRILVSGALTNESRIIINRNIMQRVQTLMPQLMFDREPYIVIADGRLFWIIDAYTTSSNFPYSEPFSVHGMSNPNRINYIRNSVKIVIDAYNGTTDFFIVDPNDPIAATLSNIFPDLFKDFADMPEFLQPHIRYPNMLLNIQAHMFRRYHMTNATTFYLNEDWWDIASEIVGDTTTMTPMTPNYFIMKLPGEDAAEFVNTIPFTPRDRPNMSGLLIARNDGEHYGELVLFQLPRGRQIPGPAQVDAQIEVHPQISIDFSLWDQAGSTVNRGNMFVVPIENTFLYVKPIYLEAEAGAIPEVRRVIVAYGVPDGDGVVIAYQPTLAEALEELFGPPLDVQQPEPPVDVEPPVNGERPEPPVQPGTPDAAELIRLASQALENAQRAQRNGDWAAYGRYMQQVERFLGQLMAL